MKASARPKNLLEFAEARQGLGHYSFTKQEAMTALKISSQAFGKSAQRLIQATKIMRVRNNFYTVVPPEYRAAKGLPPTFFIDRLMKFNEQPYYIGILSAAALHGAAHQAPQELQVVTSKPLPLLQAGNLRIRFVTKKWVKQTPIQTVKTPTGFVQVSTPEATALDLLRYVRVAGHLDNVTTILVELADKLNSAKLAETAKIEKELAYAQRLGYLLDRFVSDKYTKAMHVWVSKQNPSPVFLRSDKRTDVVERNEKWNLLVNAEVTPDI